MGQGQCLGCPLVSLPPPINQAPSHRPALWPGPGPTRLISPTTHTQTDRQSSRETRHWNSIRRAEHVQLCLHRHSIYTHATLHIRAWLRLLSFTVDCCYISAVSKLDMQLSLGQWKPHQFADFYTAWIKANQMQGSLTQVVWLIFGSRAHQTCGYSHIA